VALVRVISGGQAGVDRAALDVAIALASAFELDRALVVIDAATPAAGLGDARELLEALQREASLNVAGPRESEQPGIYERAVAVLAELFAAAG
jgi:hypothetical protein